jgi:hypothetical protein
MRSTTRLLILVVSRWLRQLIPIHSPPRGKSTEPTRSPGVDATTLEDLVDEAEASESTLFRAFSAKAAAAVEAEAEP